MSEPDVVVIGAGPGGGCAAWTLASRGVRVLLVDRAPFPRSKLCGGCLARTGAAALDRIGLGSSLESLKVAPRSQELELVSGALRTRVVIPEYRVIDRSAFDHEIVLAAQTQGAECLHGFHARVDPDGSVTLDSGSELRRVHPRVVVVADGLQGSSLDHDTRFSWRKEQASRVGVGATSSLFPAGLPSDAITMMHTREGYLGIARMHDGCAVIAAAIDPVWLRDHARGSALGSVMRRHGFDESEFGSLSRTTGSSALTRKRSVVEADGRTFLIGDATGYIEPFTGEGMSWSIGHAERLAPIVLDALAGRDVRAQWSRELSQSNRSRTALCRIVTKTARSATLTRTMIRVCGSSRSASKLVSRAVHHLQGAA